MLQAETTRAPTTGKWTYDECTLSHELAQEALTTMCVICSRQEQIELEKPEPDHALIQLWRDERTRFAQEMNSLTFDEAQLREILDRYSPIVRKYYNWDQKTHLWYGLDSENGTVRKRA